MNRGSSSDTFTDRLQKLGDRIERNVADLKGHVMDVIQQHIIAGTPVSAASTGHSGRARSNWFISVNQPYEDAQYDGEFDPSGTQRMESNTAVILANPGINVQFYLNNNLDYIGWLNAGNSTQAPANFVRIALMYGIREIKEARIVSG